MDARPRKRLLAAADVRQPLSKDGPGRSLRLPQRIRRAPVGDLVIEVPDFLLQRGFRFLVGRRQQVMTRYKQLEVGPFQAV